MKLPMCRLSHKILCIQEISFNLLTKSVICVRIVNNNSSELLYNVIITKHRKKNIKTVLFHYVLSLYEVQEESSHASLQCSQQNQQLLLIKDVYSETFKYQQKDEC